MRHFLLVGLLLAAAAPALAQQKLITVQPIAVCNTDGSNCPNAAGLIATSKPYVDAIYAQAQTAISFLPVAQYKDSSFSSVTVDPNGLTDQSRRLMRDPGHLQSPDPQVLNMFFVQDLKSSGGGTPLAYSFINGNGMIIGPTPRVDTIAHELGHNLGLDHTTLGAGGPSNLMTDGISRSIPASIADITTGKTDQLTPAQIAQVRAPAFSVNNTRFIAVANTRSLVGNPGATYTELTTVSPAGYPNLTPTKVASRIELYGQSPATAPASLPNGELTGLKVRFLAGTSVDSGVFVQPDLVAAEIQKWGPFVTDPSYTCASFTDTVCSSNRPAYLYTITGAKTLAADNTIEFVWNLKAAPFRSVTFGCTAADNPATCYKLLPNTAPASQSPITPYDFLNTAFFDKGCGDAWTPGQPICAAPLPFSVQFVFANGFASQGFFDHDASVFDPLNPLVPGSFTWAADVTPPVIPEGTVGAIEFAAVPEPGALGLLLAGLGALGLARRRAVG